MSIDIKMGVWFHPPILDWVLHRCWSKDAEDADSRQRAMQHHSAFMSAIEEKTASDEAVSPRAVAGIVRNLVDQARLGGAS